MLDLRKLFLMWMIIVNVVFGRPIKEITETRDTPETQIPAGFSDSHSDTLKPSEIQKAVCTVTSGDVRASAEAFTTRELKGVCSSSEMMKAFNDLESKLGRELQNIHILLQDLHQQFTMQNVSESSVEPITSAGSSYFATPSPFFKFQPIPLEHKQPKINELTKKNYSTPKLKSLPSKEENKKPLVGQREKEVSRNDDDILITDKDVKLYTYYWRVENFTRSLRSAKSLSMESPIFSIRGKAFKIHAHFQHLHRDYLYLQLEDFSSAPALNLGNSIILDSGGMFKEISSDNFRYKMSILDQNKKRSSDLVSQEFDNYDTGFSIPNSALIDSPFIKDDSLLIQLFLYF